MILQGLLSRVLSVTGFRLVGHQTYNYIFLSKFDPELAENVFSKRSKNQLPSNFKILETK